MQAAAMEIERRLEMLSLTKSIGLLLDRLDLGIEPLTDGVGDLVTKIVQNLRQILAKHPGFLYHRSKARMSCPEKPRFKMTDRPAHPMISPQIAKALFDRPCLWFQVQPLQASPSFLVALGEVFPRVQPDVLGSAQRLVPRSLHHPVLFLPNLTDSLYHMAHEMIAIKSNLLFDIWDLLPKRGQIEVPDIHSDGPNLLPGPLGKPPR